MQSLVEHSLQSGTIFVRIGVSFYTFPVVQSPEDIRLKLIRLKQEAQSVSPNLASRLDEMRRWINTTTLVSNRNRFPHHAQFLSQSLACKMVLPIEAHIHRSSGDKPQMVGACLVANIHSLYTT
ncbi:MAG: hypothetical protein PUP92_24180 [Rhizonema sp. PD38]|nr:hypothetical protein [Rhizonema sp. PD38]